MPKVHHIREEKIEREIHTYDVIHRVLPVIDVEVLPPRHFVPVAGGGLKEVSADELPGRQGHWGIVETVTRPSSARPGRPSSPLEPEVINLPPSTSTDGLPVTETIVRHPPTLEVGARETGQTWPMIIAPDHYEAIHGMPATAGIARVPDEPRRPHDPRPSSHASVPDIPDPGPGMSNRSRPSARDGASDDPGMPRAGAPMQTDQRGLAFGRSRP